MKPLRLAWRTTDAEVAGANRSVNQTGLPPLHTARLTLPARVLFALLTVVITFIGVKLPIIAIALVYLSGYLALAWYKPQIALMLIVVASPFQNDLSGGGPARFSIAEIHLVLCGLVLLLQVAMKRKRLVFGPITVPIVLYCGWCLFATMIHFRDTAPISLMQQFLYFGFVVIVFASFVPRAEDMAIALKGLVVVGVFLACAELATGYTFLGLHKNGVGASMSCSVIVGVELLFAATDTKRRVLYGLALAMTGVGLIFSLSRGAWLGTLTGLTTILVVRREFRTFLWTTLLLIPLVVICWNALPDESRLYATNFDKGRVNIEMRYRSLAFAQEHFAESPIIGVGVGLRKEFDATNIMWTTLAETGVIGLVVFLLLHFELLRMIWTTQKYLRRTDPLYSLVALSGALMLGKMVHGTVDIYWSRGPIMIALASAGMATAASMQVYRRMQASNAAAGSLPHRIAGQESL